MPRTLIMFVLLFFALDVSLAEENRKIGFISYGAHVIPNDPNTTIDETATRLRVGYLPVGTVVFVGGLVPIREKASSKPKHPQSNTFEHPYYEVVSSIGINGLVKKDQVTFLNGRKVAIAVNDKKIQVSSTRNPNKPVGSFSRTDGVYVEIVDDKKSDYYVVKMPWSNPPNITGKIRRVNEKTATEDGDYIVINEAKLTETPIKFITVSRVLTERADQITGLPISIITRRLDESLKDISDELEYVTNLRCAVDVKLVAETGLKIFGNGLGVEGAVNIFESGSMYDIDMEFMVINNTISHTLISLKKIKCERVIVPVPVKMSAFGLFVDRSKANGNSFYVLSAPGTNIGEDGFVIPSDEGETPRMINIKNWYDYERSISKLRDEVPKNKLLRSLEKTERDALLHYVLSKIAYFYPEK